MKPPPIFKRLRALRALRSHQLLQGSQSRLWQSRPSDPISTSRLLRVSRQTKQGRGRGRIQDQPSLCENSKDKRHSRQGAYARARIPFKAARFRAPKAGLVQLRAASRCPQGEEGAAFERDALSRGLLAPTKPQCAWLQSQKRKDTIMTTTTKRPSHKVYAVTKGQQAQLLAGDRSRLGTRGRGWLQYQTRYAAAQRRGNRHPQTESDGRRRNNRLTQGGPPQGGPSSCLRSLKRLSLRHRPYCVSGMKTSPPAGSIVRVLSPSENGSPV